MLRQIDADLSAITIHEFMGGGGRLKGSPPHVKFSLKATLPPLKLFRPKNDIFFRITSRGYYKSEVK